jgi:hypothetical protein
MTNKDTQGEELAKRIADAIKDHPHAEVRVNPIIQAPIPPHIAGNLLELLRRVRCTGMESVAWVEAYQFVQQHAPQQPAQPGVPFVPFGGPPQPSVR